MRPGRGILLMIVAVTLFTAMSALIKAGTQRSVASGFAGDWKKARRSVGKSMRARMSAMT